MLHYHARPQSSGANQNANANGGYTVYVALAAKSAALQAAQEHPKKGGGASRNNNPRSYSIADKRQGKVATTKGASGSGGYIY